MLTDDDILSAAVRAFGRQGYDAVSLRDLNRELGASHAMIANRFGTKQALWMAAAEWAFARHRDALLGALGEPRADDLEQLRHVVRCFVATAADYPELQQLINQEGSSPGARVEFLYERCIRPLVAGLIRPLLDQLHESGRSREVTDRDAFFLIANGAAAVFAMAPLSRCFDAHDGPLRRNDYADHVADLVTAALAPG